MQHRRDFLKAASASLAVVPAAASPAPFRELVFGPFLFGCVPYQFRLTERDGTQWLAREPFDVSALPHRPQPVDVRPTSVKVLFHEMGNGHIRRTWRDEDAPRCCLCKLGCSVALDRVAGEMYCNVLFALGDDVSDPAMYRADTPIAAPDPRADR